MPQDTEFFSDVANCYAYAAKCANPTNSGGGRFARPGGANSTQDPTADCATFRAGVLADGGARVNAVGPRISVNAFTAVNIPRPRADWYLIAMLVKGSGFHFVRRQRSRFIGSPFWKWKQGNLGTVERNAYDGAANSWIRVTNDRFVELVQNRLVTDGPGYGGWVYLQFFEVHAAGFTVTAS